MRILEGHFEDVDLAGLKWVAVIRWPGPWYGGNGIMEHYVDDAAQPKQRSCLTQILAGEVGGPFFGALHAALTTTYGPNFLPIDFGFDLRNRRARIVISDFVYVATEPLSVPFTSEEQRVVVRLPGGLACHEIEAANCRTLRSAGMVSFEWKNTHSALATIEYSDRGFVD